jgi:hypothetical protein
VSFSGRVIEVRDVSVNRVAMEEGRRSWPVSYALPRENETHEAR